MCGCAITELGSVRWTDDPLKTHLPSALPIDTGSTKIRQWHFGQLQNTVNNEQDVLVTRNLLLPGDKIILTPNLLVSPILWNNFRKKWIPTKTVVEDLRRARELCLSCYAISMEDYFKYDYRGYLLGTPVVPAQTDWTDSDLTHKQIRAIHIEELRKTLPVSIIEDFRNCDYHYAYNDAHSIVYPQNLRVTEFKTIDFSNIGANLAWQLPTAMGGGVYTQFNNVFVDCWIMCDSPATSVSSSACITVDITPDGLKIHVDLRLSVNSIVDRTRPIEWLERLWGGLSHLTTVPGFVCHLPTFTIRNNSILLFDADLTGFYYNHSPQPESGIIGQTELGGLATGVIAPGTYNLGTLIGEGVKKPSTSPSYTIKCPGRPIYSGYHAADGYLSLNPAMWYTEGVPDGTPINGDARYTFDFVLRSIKILQVREGVNTFV